MKNKFRSSFVLLIVLIASPLSSFASEPLPAGKIENLSYRGGWVMFKVVDDNGTNLCQPCPTDPGVMGATRCWIQATLSAQISMLLSAQARGKKVYGRVYSFTSDCNVYQMMIED